MNFTNNGRVHEQVDLPNQLGSMPWLLELDLTSGCDCLVFASLRMDMANQSSIVFESPWPVSLRYDQVGDMTN